jgi:penicillin-binding protein 2
MAILLGLLLVAFFRIQVLRSETWRLQSESNRLRPLPVPAPRGTIFDREGKIIADNVPGYSVSLLPAPTDSIRRSLQDLQPILGITEERIEELLQVYRLRPTDPLLVESDASFETVSALSERRMQLPEVFLEMRPKRRYQAGAAVGHAMGYVGEITAEELEQPRFVGYEQGAIVGKEGIERQYETLLQGTQGTRIVEVDALGRVVGSFRGQTGKPATPGSPIHLTLDLALMEWIHRIFPDSMRGAVVALDVQDGGVLALYSSPSYDPNLFVGGIAPEIWSDLTSDEARPLYNRTTLGRYPPASPWKLATAAIGLQLGVVTPEERMPVPCRGGIQFGNRFFRCWQPRGHGSLSLADAIRHSCDVYFYQLGLRIGLSRLLEEGNRIGFGRQCGIDLPQESGGIFPEDTGFWEERWGYRPTEAEVLSLAIGQGPNSQTPLRMAQFYLALARNGSAPAPHLLRDGAVAEAWSLNLDPGSLEVLREGLRRVVRPGGTAYMSSLEHWDLLGKTGTGENPHGRDHAWFAAIAGPWNEDPEIVVVVLVEFGESGSRTAAPIAAKTADYFLRLRYGIPIDTVQTLREHYMVGRPAPWAAR